MLNTTDTTAKLPTTVTHDGQEQRVVAAVALPDFPGRCGGSLVIFQTGHRFATAEYVNDDGAHFAYLEDVREDWTYGEALTDLAARINDELDAAYR